MGDVDYMAIDQYGQTEHALGKHPRKELLRRCNVRHADRMYQDERNGAAVHVGWVIAGRWFSVYEVRQFSRAKGD